MMADRSQNHEEELFTEEHPLLVGVLVLLSLRSNDSSGLSSKSVSCSVDGSAAGSSAGSLDGSVEGSVEGSAVSGS